MKEELKNHLRDIIEDTDSPFPLEVRLETYATSLMKRIEELYEPKMS